MLFAKHFLEGANFVVEVFWTKIGSLQQLIVPKNSAVQISEDFHHYYSKKIWDPQFRSKGLILYYFYAFILKCKNVTSCKILFKLLITVGHTQSNYIQAQRETFFQESRVEYFLENRRWYPQEVLGDMAMIKLSTPLKFTDGVQVCRALYSWPILLEIEGLFLSQYAYQKDRLTWTKICRNRMSEMDRFASFLAGETLRVPGMQMFYNKPLYRYFC